MCTNIWMYLFHILVHQGLRHALEEFKRLFSRMKELFVRSLVCIKLAPDSIAFCCIIPLFGIELAYGHNVLFRLFYGLMEINGVHLLISLCISLWLGINSFYYEYCHLSIFSKPQGYRYKAHAISHTYSDISATS